MTARAAALNETATALDLLVAPAWRNAVHWVDVFVGGADDTFRQWPGSVGSLDANADGIRTYRPTQRQWYSATATQTPAALLAPSDRASYFPRGNLTRPPLILSQPYVDAFGRGYLLSLTAAAVSPAGSAKACAPIARRSPPATGSGGAGGRFSSPASTKRAGSAGGGGGAGRAGGGGGAKLVGVKASRSSLRCRSTRSSAARSQADTRSSRLEFW